MLQNFNISQEKRLSIIWNWLGRQGLQLLETLMLTDQEAFNYTEDLLKNTK